jgi:hypothetical protein
MLLVLVGCPKKEEPPENIPRYNFDEIDFPDDEELDDLPESDTGVK